VPAEELAPGDVIVVQEPGPSGRTVSRIHRIVSLDHDGGNFVVRTKGDANEAPDPGLYVAPDHALAYSFHVPYAGFFLGFVTTTAGWIVLIVLPALALCCFTVRSVWFPGRRPPTLGLEPDGPDGR